MGFDARRIVLRLNPSLRGRVRVGLVVAEPVSIRPAGAALAGLMRETERVMRERYAGRAPGEIEPLAAARELYRGFGIDPTKTRPSSEALLRRVLRGRELPSIVNAVDLSNVLSVEFLLPIGLYDAARIDGEVELRAGGPGESYAGIRKHEVHLDGRPVLVDRSGPFGNPTSDSLRTSVDGRTTSLWMTIFAPPSLSGATLARHVERARHSIALHLAAGGAPVAACGTVVD
ncbi:MAG TPA: phenylalanine--tRNA ligase beta subunit-related protein [Candidatus Polarisedimenticolaceae bacterium]|nr:phenylalanine--tRNA ligase beta subunit-related protein [Candidatus Polarisedimenticolaceae bacterium]